MPTPDPTFVDAVEQAARIIEAAAPLAADPEQTRTLAAIVRNALAIPPSREEHGALDEAVAALRAFDPDLYDGAMTEELTAHNAAVEGVRAALRQHATPPVAGAMSDARLRDIIRYAADGVDPEPPEGETPGPLRLRVGYITSGPKSDPTDIGIEDVGADGTIAWMEEEGHASLAAAKFMAAAPELLDEVLRLRALVGVGVPVAAPAVRVEGVVVTLPAPAEEDPNGR